MGIPFFSRIFYFTTKFNAPSGRMERIGFHCGGVATGRTSGRNVHQATHSTLIGALFSNLIGWARGANTTFQLFALNLINSDK